MKYKESTKKEIDAKQINDLRASVGWTKRSGKKWKEVLSKSSFVCSVWDGDKLIGMGRILEDGAMCMFYDIVVHKDYQGKGVGRIIMEKMIGKVKNKDYAFVGLFVDRQNMEFLIPFYKKYGFEPVGTGMRRKNI